MCLKRVIVAVGVVFDANFGDVGCGESIENGGFEFGNDGRPSRQRLG